MTSVAGEKPRRPASIAPPDKLRAQLRSDRRHRDFYFDGKTLTQVVPRAGYYASVSMPGTLADNMARLAERYEREMPLEVQTGPSS